MQETLRGSLQNGGMTVTEKARLEQEIAELRQQIQQTAASSSQTAENVANSGPRRLQTTGADHQSAQVKPNSPIDLPSWGGLVVSVSTCHAVSRWFASGPGHTKDHYKNSTNYLPH